MKKFAGLLLTLVICAAFTVPAMADTFSDGDVIPPGTYDSLEINHDSNVTIYGAVKVTTSLELDMNSTLTIGYGGSLSGTKVRYGKHMNNSKIVLEPGGKLQMELSAYAYTYTFQSLLDASGVDYSRDYVTFTAEKKGSCPHRNVKTVCVDCGAEITNNTASILSGGSLTIVCTVVAAVIFGFAGFLLGKKKAK